MKERINLTAEAEAAIAVIKLNFVSPYYLGLRLGLVEGVEDPLKTARRIRRLVSSVAKSIKQNEIPSMKSALAVIALAEMPTNKNDKLALARATLPRFNVYRVFGTAVTNESWRAVPLSTGFLELSEAPSNAELVTTLTARSGRTAISLAKRYGEDADNAGRIARILSSNYGDGYEIK